jgi:hypothetical protein
LANKITCIIGIQVKTVYNSSKARVSVTGSTSSKQEIKNFVPQFKSNVHNLNNYKKFLKYDWQMYEKCQSVALNPVSVALYLSLFNCYQKFKNIEQNKKKIYFQSKLKI